MTIVVADDEVDSDNEEADPPPHSWGSGSRIGRAPNAKRRRLVYSHLLFNDFWGPLPVYNATYFKRFFKLSVGLFDNMWQRLSQRTGTSFRKRTRSGDWDCLNYRRFVPP